MKKNILISLWFSISGLTAEAATIDIQPILDSSFGFCSFSTSCTSNNAFPVPYGAENFSLTTANTISSLSVYVISDDPSLNQQRLTGVDWLIMGDSGGAPGEVLLGQQNANYSAQYFGLGTAPNGTTNHNIFRLDLSVNDLVLGAGNYWVAFRLQSGPWISISERYYWARHAVDSNANSQIGDPENGWNSPYSYSTEYSFAINHAVPVPASAWLLGSGLISLLSISRCKKNSTTMD